MLAFQASVAIANVLIPAHISITHSTEQAQTKRMQGNCHPAGFSSGPDVQEQAGRDLAGISRAIVLRVCAEQAEHMQAFKLARWAHTQLQSLHVPPGWQVLVRSHPSNPAILWHAHYNSSKLLCMHPSSALACIQQTQYTTWCTTFT